ncbi:hypothetical protein GLOTRDRAFT_113607 [Gloeophyllum trabeum ATCC 11539]|uniref:Kinetochore protein SPC25 n=1 Tax=Gloeophyllum trabeum (strain ATCC 11539 / FP-39264 / Madison 617) TaxID=670483 RepID=S7QPC3_GLOTA|nr:uncharacterized protein GLOTRDRAFT_113607 [Gloeophyllum trabeum ATCC 11539]EPQ61172.1 hypothetical protein GLOTRDRAFT_113607 [Gloeophyllum trabeum ATCC 11539]
MDPSRLNLAAILASQNPYIDPKIEAYEASTRNFLKAVSSYGNRAVTEITNRKNAYVSEKKRIADKTQQIETEITDCKNREIELLKQLEKEQQETKEAESSVSALRKQLAAIRQKCASIDVELEQYRAVTANLRREKAKERSILETHAAGLLPELRACQDRLQCVVEGIDRDRLLFRFAAIDKTAPDREYSFVLDVSSKIYKVITTTPLLPTLPILLDDLNETRDIYAFIAKMRHAFRDMSETIPSV